MRRIIAKHKNEKLDIQVDIPTHLLNKTIKFLGEEKGYQSFHIKHIDQEGVSRIGFLGQIRR